jgi:hypothetical protein
MNAPKRCDNETCGRPFGLVLHRWYTYRFCCLRRKQAFLQKTTDQRERVKQWLHFLNR